MFQNIFNQSVRRSRKDAEPTQQRLPSMLMLCLLGLFDPGLSRDVTVSSERQLSRPGVQTTAGRQRRLKQRQRRLKQRPSDLLRSPRSDMSHKTLPLFAFP
ncbi:hypothetical protein CesoFtcFv8_025096 [Champsocephalus esox]|uniref:Uncharacterized protein n=1 Tax=Champsocephalus esox TaxID=159716 RepID=A0AAN8B352_9TELE|nr:hypothetical protein CesoFtcFv8_025096 [Champsocephalus esox]